MCPRFDCIDVIVYACTQVRSAPDTNAELLGVVMCTDEIVAVARLGDWIKVKLDNCPSPEAWMLSSVPDRVLLLPKGAMIASLISICS